MTLLFDNRIESKVYAKDSMDRFGDDLTELILSFLCFEDKIRLECLSKQWRRLIYNKQFVLDICDYSKRTVNSLRKLFKGFNVSNEVRLHRRALESVLQKCHNITRVRNYSRVNSRVLSLIGQYCPNIVSLSYPRIDTSVFTFLRDYGHKLKELSLEHSDEEIIHFVKLCPNLNKVYVCRSNSLVTEDKGFLPKLVNIVIGL